MKQIKYSGDYGGKLTHEYFTTIRRWTPEKERYYWNAVGEAFAHIDKNGFVAAYADLISVSPAIPLQEIPGEFLMLDTGTSTAQEAFEVFWQWKVGPETPVMILLSKRAELLQDVEIPAEMECETA